MIGINAHVDEDNVSSTHGQKLDTDAVRGQLESLQSLKDSRDTERVLEALERLREACEGMQNVMEPLIHAVKEGATVGEVNGVMKEVFGTWMAPSGV